MNYDPFKYPPDFELARLHQRASMPGKIAKNAEICPCCNLQARTPFDSWWNRSLEKDFKNYGGAVVTYFWLLKLYFIAISIVIVVYSIYLLVLTEEHCNDSLSLSKICHKLAGTWIITNQDLYKIMDDAKEEATIVRLFTLRGIIFLVLLATNFLSMYIVRWFKIRYPEKVGITAYALLFKNIRENNIEALIKKLQDQFGNIKIKEAFMINRLEPFYTHSKDKLETYYECLNETNPKANKELLNSLYKLNLLCSKHQDKYDVEANRAIVVLNSVEMKHEILKKYKISKFEIVKRFMSNDYQKKSLMYCEECPRPEEIIWNNIGKIEQQNVKVKFLSIIYFILIVAASYAFLRFCLEFIYNNQYIVDPWKTIIQTIILLFLVAVALSFRALMNRLAEMRFPNTLTSRTKFIVITTVFFHFIYYLFIPTLYLRIEDEKRGEILNLISNQTITFIVVQILIASFDLMYCCWNRKRDKFQNEEKPIGCQNILHKKMEYPRFPIQFKLIILFKFWSFITFFAFQVPVVLFLIFLVLVFLYIKDKKNAYTHYRMEFIDNKVQFSLLQIYSNIFSIYMYVIFVFTQHLDLEKYMALAVTVIVIIIQTFFFSLKPEDETEYKLEHESQFESAIDQIENYDSYMKRYEEFVGRAQSKNLDLQINQYLSKEGYGSLQTESEIDKARLI